MGPHARPGACAAEFREYAQEAAASSPASTADQLAKLSAGVGPLAAKLVHQCG